MKINPYIFREYDIRGVAEEDLKNENVYHLARAYGTYVKKKGAEKVSVSQDIRFSSTRIKSKFIEGLLDTGLKVTDIGTCPTPVLFFSVFFFDLDGGVQITGSHNPKEFNGMKLLCGKESMYGRELRQLRIMIEKEAYLEGSGKLEEIKDIIGLYIEEITKRVEIEKELHIAVDPGNGTCGPVIEKLYRKFPIKFKGVNMTPNGSFPSHLPDPTIEKYLKDLFELMDKESFDAAIGFDGDGDRLGAIDNQKRIIFGDKILAILSRKVMTDYPDSKIIIDVKSSRGVIEYIKKYGGVPILWKTGHSLIEAKLRGEKAPLAGEMSGHMFFCDRYYGYDDAIYASLRLFEVLSQTGLALSELHDEIPSYYATPEIRLNCPDEKKFEVVKKVRNKFSLKYKVIDLDGARVEFPDGFGLVRASNTQPVLVVRFEGKTREKLKEIKEIIIRELMSYPEIDLTGV